MTANDSAPTSDCVPDAAVLLSAQPASAGERRLALGVVLASGVLFLFALPFATRPLPRVWAFIPIYQSALIVIDLITAALLFSQVRVSRSRALTLLASGYVFTAAIAIAHALTFPDLFTAGGLLGAGPQSTAWIYMFWHGGFPLVVIAYARRKRDGNDGGARPGNHNFHTWGYSLVALAAAVALTLLATAGEPALPAIMRDNHYTPVMILVVGAVWALSALALAVLWRSKPHSVLDTWLMVVMCAWLFDVALSAAFNAGRFDLGFYAGRVYGLMAASLVLIVLLLHQGRLYARLVDVHAAERRRSLDLEQLGNKIASANGELADVNARLLDASRLKSEFLSNMSHELRQPLNSIMGFSELLGKGMVGELTEKQHVFVGHILQSGQHLLALINDVLDLSKIEAGKVEAVFEPMDLDAALTESLSLIGDQARGKRIRLSQSLHGRLGAANVDRRRFKQILINLLSNAVKFTREGGQVMLATAWVDTARAASAMPGFEHGMRVPLTDVEGSRFLEISVFDSGIGISPQEMGDLFQPFSQINNALTRRLEGTGLGLAMVLRLTQLHGGALAVTSEAGKGSCFTVWIPGRDANAPQADTTPLPAVPPSRQACALIVEDDAGAAALMQAQLEAAGFRVRRVASAEAALELVGEFVPDVITLDILLPGMDGWEFLARLRSTPSWDSVPVVVVSLVADKRKGFALGAAMVLQKPISHDALTRGLDRLNLKPNDNRELTVLVIDDDPIAVEVLATYLHRRHYFVLRALGGQEGIALARRFLPDLIALDLEMPDVSGFDVVEALKGDGATAQIPILVVTAKELNRDDREQLNGHIHEIVGKADFTQDRFVGEVQRALARPA